MLLAVDSISATALDGNDGSNGGEGGEEETTSHEEGGIKKPIKNKKNKKDKEKYIYNISDN